MAAKIPIDDRSGHGLKRSHLIGQLSTESLGHLGALANRVELEKGEVLFFQEDPGDSIYIVDSGVVEISILSVSGKKLALNVMRPPDVFGEIAALDGGPRTATATTLERSTLLRFDRADIMAEIKKRPELAADLIQILCARLRWVSQQVEDLAMLNIEGRLASRLLILHRKFSDKYGKLYLSQSELADFLGATRESINKILQEWRANGLIELSRGAVKVCDQRSLADIAELN